MIKHTNIRPLEVVGQKGTRFTSDQVEEAFDAVERYYTDLADLTNKAPDRESSDAVFICWEEQVNKTEEQLESAEAWLIFVEADLVKYIN